MVTQRNTIQTNSLLSHPILKHPAFAIFFVLFFPLVIEYTYSDFVRGSELNSRIGWFILILAIVWLFRQKLFPFLLLSVFLISGCMDNLYAVTFGGVFTTASFEAMALTDRQEAVGFLQTYASFENLSLLAIYMTGSVYFLKTAEIPTEKSRSQKTIIIFGMVLLAVAIYRIGFMKSYYDTIPGFAGTLPSYFAGHGNVAKEIENRKKLVENSPIVVSLDQPDEKQTYLIIIGESLSRKHMGIYGYHRNTTPELSKLSDELIIHTDTISTFVQTQPSLRRALTQMGTDNNLSIHNALSIVDIANKAGFKTWWISNQQPLRSTISAIANMADETQFISNDYHGVQVRRFDGLLQPYAEKAINDSSSKKVIFLHLMGSHLQYKNRYPEEFSQFTDNQVQAYKKDLSDKQLDYINSYDNSVLYTDKVVTDIILNLKEKSEEQGLISASLFFSDHGEDVFDTKDFVGHGPDSVTTPMIEIPFIIWSSNKYREMRPAHFDNMKNNTSQPSSLEDSFHIVASLMGIQSDLINPQRSLTSKTYSNNKRLVYGTDYDAEIKN